MKKIYFATIIYNDPESYKFPGVPHIFDLWGCADYVGVFSKNVDEGISLGGSTDGTNVLKPPKIYYTFFIRIMFIQITEARYSKL